MRKIVSITIAFLVIISLAIISGVSGCQKGAAAGSCEHGHDLSTCPDGTARCCLSGWICCSENGENSCTPDSFCSEQEVSDVFAGT